MYPQNGELPQTQVVIKKKKKKRIGYRWQRTNLQTAIEPRRACTTAWQMGTARLLPADYQTL